MSKYLDYFPKPFLDDLVNSRCIPIIGAGFSKNAEIPHGRVMPNWDELGKMIAKDISDYGYVNPIDALSTYEHEYSRPKLIEKLHECLLVDEISPSETHFAFCRLPFDLCITTNIEFLLEKAYANINTNCRPIIEEGQLSVKTSDTSVDLFKFHGDLNHSDRLVITELDYDIFINKYPLLSTFLANQLITKTALLIGYSLDDPDFRQIWQIIGNRLGKQRRLAYTILVEPSDATINSFNRRGVRVIRIPGDTKHYNVILKDVFDELYNYWMNTIYANSVGTDDEVYAELLIPDKDLSRLCFFAVPTKLSAFYKSFVFPIVEKYGLVPMLAIDVFSPGENVLAKISSFLDRAELIIVDISSKNTEFELQMALARKNKKIIVVLPENMNIPSDLSGVIYINKSLKPNQLNKFFENLEKEIDILTKDFKEELDNEPIRLLEMKVYRAAIISAISIIELKITKFLENQLKDDTLKYYGSFITIRMLVKLVFEHKVINKNEFEKLNEWIDVRNRIVHSEYTIGAKKAKEIVKGIQAIIIKINEKL